MPRFVLLYHDCPPSFGKPSHWDLMLERDGVLMAWSPAELPAAWHSPLSERVEDAPIGLQAARLPDHRLAYLEYEGPISGGRGHVTRHDAGTYEVLEETAGMLRVQLSGELIRGIVTLSIAPPKSEPE